MARGEAETAVRRPRRAAGAVLLLVLALALPLARAAAIEASEATIKAAFLYKFGFFIDWPSAAFAAKDSPFILCLVGDDAFDAILDSTVKGQKVGDHPVTVKRMNTVARDAGCHVAYLRNTPAAQAGPILAALHGAGVLTVTDLPESSDPKGIINFVIKDERVRFDIDDAAAASDGLTISSRLLNLAVSVKPRH